MHMRQGTCCRAALKSARARNRGALPPKLVSDDSYRGAPPWPQIDGADASYAGIGANLER